MTNLVIVESPFKAPTIKGYLGSNYKVISSVGHIRDLPKSTLGVDIENDFKPKYINIRGKADVINNIRAEAKKAKNIYFATDPDREGEAISWHLANVIGIPVTDAKRISFNEITKKAVAEAVRSPRKIDMNLVDAQQARRILDRIVGYKLSPVLWKTMKGGLSAGRVQSVAAKIIVDRENEIRAFVPDEYWTLDALLDHSPRGIYVRFYGDENGKIKISNEEEVLSLKNSIEGKPFYVKSVKKTSKSKTPVPPFTTSTLQQEASSRLGFRSAQTMQTAQRLYEGINLGQALGGNQGLITYMRTDSIRVAKEAQIEAREYILKEYGADYCPKTFREFKSRGKIQDAHEAIRPTHVEFTPELVKEFLTDEQYGLYKLIWNRFVASQTAPAKISVTTVDFSCGNYIFRASGSEVVFKGYTAIYEDAEDEEKSAARDKAYCQKIPPLTEGAELRCVELLPKQHFTEPPPRYTEASLIKAFEEKGIGRPSTYTPTITTIVTRGYVRREGKTLFPTELGEMTTNLIARNFPDVIDCKFTADMETELDEIAGGNLAMTEVLAGFWEKFKKELDTAETESAAGLQAANNVVSDVVCENCGCKMVVKHGRYGSFLACPNYPECKNTKPLDADGKIAKKEEPEYADFKCEKCGAPMVKKKGKYGVFYACTNYPECKFTKKIRETVGVACPECGAAIVVKHGKAKGKIFYGCERYPDCGFSSWDLPTAEKCPLCGGMLFKKKSGTLYCAKEGCGYKDVSDKK